MPSDASVPVPIARTRRAKAAREFALVLSATGIDCEMHQEGSEAVLTVAPDDADRALQEIALYRHENRGWRRADELPLVLGESWLAVVAWVFTLLLTHWFALWGLGRRDALDLGELHAAEVQGGQLWRAVTALGLHADPPHLLGNLLFGALFVALVAEMLGTGVGLFAVVACGALANLANAWIAEPDFRAIGASTAVFAALGLLGGYRWRQRKLVRSLRRASWIPLVAAAFLLAYLGAGSSDDMGVHRIDVTGHALGFAVGAVIGALYASAAPRALLPVKVQWVFGLAALALWTGAWYTAVR